MTSPSSNYSKTICSITLSMETQVKTIRIIVMLFNFLTLPTVSMSDRVSSDDSELSDLESVISQDARDQGARGQEAREAWPLSSLSQSSGL